MQVNIFRFVPELPPTTTTKEQQKKEERNGARDQYLKRRHNKAEERAVKSEADISIQGLHAGIKQRPGIVQIGLGSFSTRRQARRDREG